MKARRGNADSYDSNDSLKISGRHESVEADASERSFDVFASSSVAAVLLFHALVTICTNTRGRSRLCWSANMAPLAQRTAPAVTYRRMCVRRKPGRIRHRNCTRMSQWCSCTRGGILRCLLGIRRRLRCEENASGY